MEENEIKELVNSLKRSFLELSKSTIIRLFFYIAATSITLLLIFTIFRISIDQASDYILIIQTSIAFVALIGSRKVIENTVRLISNSLSYTDNRKFTQHNTVFQKELLDEVISKNNPQTIPSKRLLEIRESVEEGLQ